MFYFSDKDEPVQEYRPAQRALKNFSFENQPFEAPLALAAPQLID